MVGMMMQSLLPPSRLATAGVAVTWPGRRMGQPGAMPWLTGGEWACWWATAAPVGWEVIWWRMTPPMKARIAAAMESGRRELAQIMDRITSVAAMVVALAEADCAAEAMARAAMIAAEPAGAVVVCLE